MDAATKASLAPVPSLSSEAPATPAEPDTLALLRWAHLRWGERLAVVTSFQASGSVILDLAHRAGLPLRVLTLDTGRLPEETYQLIERVRARYEIEIELIAPDADELASLVRAGGPNLFRRSAEERIRCCHVRKVEPFRRAVRDLDAWISGARRDQGQSRESLQRVGVDRVNRPEGGLVKISPLADWTESRVWSYIRAHAVPYHPLYDRGYRSIGCAPCTRPTRPGEDARASRWWWERSGAKECGLHLVHIGGGA